MGKIAVVGSSNTDLTIKTNRIPSPGETVLGGTFMMNAGGKGANQAVAAARLGGEVAFVAKVGDDMFGRRSLDNYRKEKMSADFVTTSDIPSGVALISVDSKGENSIVVAPGANNALTKADIDKAREVIVGADLVLMQLEVPMEVIEYTAKIAFDAGVKVVLNPAPAAKLSDELLSRLFLITPNETECSLLTGVEICDIESAASAADVLLQKGVENVIITLGSNGSLIHNRVMTEQIKAQKVAAVDTTAAGDVYNGALCVALSRGESLVEAAKFATLASAISVTRLGAQSSIPYIEEIKAI